jgi:hypothetical protein
MHGKQRGKKVVLRVPVAAMLYEHLGGFDAILGSSPTAVLPHR